MAVQLLVAGIGASWFIQLVSDGLVLLKWLGIAYLSYLGVQGLWRSARSEAVSDEPSGSSTFFRGFIVSLANPKTILFFSAFLPQFVSSPKGFSQEIVLLSLSFLVMAIILDSGYALLSARLRAVFQDRDLWSVRSGGVSGILFLGAAAWLALTRRSA